MARSFYEDDEVVITKPGYNAEISKDLKQQQGAHGDVSLVKGMTIRTVPYLESSLNKARLYLHDKLSVIEAEIDTQISATRNELNTLSTKVSTSIKDPVLPNIIYILTLTLTGSILASKSSLPTRFLAPTLFGTASFAYYMPQTFQGTKAKLVYFESEKFPEVFQQQSKILKELDNQKTQLEATLASTETSLTTVVHDARVYIYDLFK
ncbi:hypothetical protein PSN45_001679 [Yamadazyma tenuis]|uniref:MICOS complex subunit n=1 Tax=Candida tenuis (strain ATCC 10573 / BCRC 21748 / CBS 615 / JCM 9827 / NBRC 10315 / NRRL Y-1498 / VKM Y-70) TaxID=590646 RepID=G3BEJ5_CANTC|nr:uncharacterized protein CANTEDRAFT_99945 [Yamadazyma tenuis ATCC 10573]EGV60558.1 hypothetical protein CANTEDRAFT_99945 [Yamadazyma tenuis ATCC 10573]WEJ94199.1 hypothetical protein PSN45_001679 [Yamadazyma tenuis]